MSFSIVYANDLVLTWRSFFLLVSVASQLGGLFWNLMLSGFCGEECVTGVEEGFGNVLCDNF